MSKGEMEHDYGGCLEACDLCAAYEEGYADGRAEMAEEQRAAASRRTEDDD